jgi:uncharacterized membrane protein (UPF0136 family)
VRNAARRAVDDDLHTMPRQISFAEDGVIVVVRVGRRVNLGSGRKMGLLVSLASFLWRIDKSVGLKLTPVLLPSPKILLVLWICRTTHHCPTPSGAR